MPYLHASVTEDEASGQGVVYALNRHLREEMDLEVVLRGFGPDRSIVTALQVSNPNFKAVNTKDEPNNVAPQPIKSIAMQGHTLKAKLAPGSWSVIVTAAA